MRTQAEQRKDAAKLLNIYEKKGLDPKVRKEFIEDGVIYCTFCNYFESSRMPVMMKLSENPELEAKAREYEEKHNVVVYYAMYMVNPFDQWILCLFCTSPFEEDWEMDVYTVEHNCPIAMVYNRTCDFYDHDTIFCGVEDGMIVS
jgi:hypothetical protein